MGGVEVESQHREVDHFSDVRVDDRTDQRVPVDRDVPMAVETQLPAVDDPEVVGPVYRVGPHRCQLTDGDTRITCTKCGRYVTTYKGTWRNMGTIAKQPCRQKARRQRGREGKAPSKQSGGALPALPPGSRPRGRVPQASKKLKTHDSRTPIASASCAAQTPKSPRDAEKPQPFFPKSRLEEPEGSSSAPQLQCGLCRGNFPARGLHSRAIREQIVKVC
eukprot:1784173-Amphidinium_carterae.1